MLPTKFLNRGEPFDPTPFFEDALSDYFKSHNLTMLPLRSCRAILSNSWKAEQMNAFMLAAEARGVFRIDKRRAVLVLVTAGEASHD